MIRRHLALVLALLLGALVLPAAAAAANQLYNCGFNVRVIEYENKSNDHSDGDDTLSICVPPGFALNIANLHGIDHILPTECNSLSVPFGSPTWGDCASSFWVATGWTLCYYRDTNWSGPWVGQWIGNNTRFDLGSSSNDQVSSIRIKPGVNARCTQIAAPAG